MSYKNADKCHKCPQSNGENGCPWWWELIENNDQGQERVMKTCGKAYLPRLMVEVIKASNRPSAELSAMRDQIVEGAQLVYQNIASLALEKHDQTPPLSDK